MARLATIDEAQKKIETLTGSVVSLQELLGDKKTRGAFGEDQTDQNGDGHHDGIRHRSTIQGLVLCC